MVHLNSIVSNLIEDELEEILRNRRIDHEERRLPTLAGQSNIRDAVSKIEVLIEYNSRRPEETERLASDDGFERESFHRPFQINGPLNQDSKLNIRS